MQTLEDLLNTLPQTGTVSWIGLREQRRMPLKTVASARALAGTGLEGDHFRGKENSNENGNKNGSGKRQVTLIQAEHLAAIASLLQLDSVVEPALLRRNIAVRGINLMALKGKTFQLGEAVFEYTGLCHPCSRMEEIFGAGGYNAVRGHGGITARVLSPGSLAVGDPVFALDCNKDDN